MSSSRESIALPPGAVVGDYRLDAVHSSWGFCQVYLAAHVKSGTPVAVHELLPEELVKRLEGGSVIGISKEAEVRMGWASERFLREGRDLMACSHPALQKIVAAFEANGTAYWVTPREEARTLKTFLQQLGRPPKEAELRRILDPLLAGLERAHAAELFHLNLKPETIQIAIDGSPRLVRFSGARQAIARCGHEASAVTTGYSAPEQYRAEKDEGPWTDIYGLAAVVHRAISGQAPPDAAERLARDTYRPLAGRYTGSYSPGFLTAIDAALAVEPTDRPQSIQGWRAMLGVSRATNPYLWPAVAAATALLLVLGVAAWLLLPPPHHDDPPQDDTAQNDQQEQKTEDPQKAQDEAAQDEKLKKEAEAMAAEEQKKREEEQKEKERMAAAEKPDQEKMSADKEATAKVEAEKLAAEEAARLAKETADAAAKAEAARIAAEEAARTAPADDPAKKAELDKAAAKAAAVAEAAARKAEETRLTQEKAEQARKEAEAELPKLLAMLQAAKQAEEAKAVQQAMAEAEKRAAEQGKMAPEKAAAEQAAAERMAAEKAVAERAAAERMAAEKAAAEKAATEKAAAEKAAAEKAEAEKMAADKAKSDPNQGKYKKTGKENGAADDDSSGKSKTSSGGSAVSGIPGIWETTATDAQGKPKRRLVIYDDGRYLISDNENWQDRGVILANAGRIQMKSDSTNEIVRSSFKLRSLSQIVTSGALGDDEWKRVSASPGNDPDKPKQ